MEADRGHARPVRGCLSLRVYIRIDLVLVTRPQHGGHVERPRARRGVAPSWSAGATARDQPHTDEPAPFEAAEDSQPLINREAARDVVSASISTGRVRAWALPRGEPAATRGSRARACINGALVLLLVCSRGRLSRCLVCGLDRTYPRILSRRNRRVDP